MKNLQIMSVFLWLGTCSKSQGPERERCGYIWGYIQMSGAGGGYTGHLTRVCSHPFSQKKNHLTQFYQNINTCKVWIVRIQVKFFSSIYHNLDKDMVSEYIDFKRKKNSEENWTSRQLSLVSAFSWMNEFAVPVVGGQTGAAAAAAAKSLQSCPTLCDPIDGTRWRFITDPSAGFLALEELLLDGLQLSLQM